MSITLFPHNQTAYDAARRMLDTAGKAAVIHPTGSGKSFIGFKLCEDNPDKSVLWLSPSEYIFCTQLENLAAAADGYQPGNVRFMTYRRLSLMTAEELAALRPDIIVYDEFHRCGARIWQKGVTRLRGLYPGIPYLGLSATSIRFLDGRRDMSAELFDGYVASEMTLGEAIVRGILAAPKYVTGLYAYQKDLDKYEQRVRRARNPAVRDAAEESLRALRRALDMADGLDVIFDRHMTDRRGKYIVFTPNVSSMRRCMARASEWFGRVDAEPRVYHVYSCEAEAGEAFRRFKEDAEGDHLRLLFAIDALNEGIHVDDVSGVILFRPTVSPIIYKQQIGRALTAGSTKTPVIFDIVDNFDSLYSVGAIEEEMREAVSRFGADERGELVTERFRVIDEVRECRALVERLEENLSASWDRMYEMAARYYEERGDLEVPVSYRTEDGYRLGAWISAQRRIRNGKCGGVLSPEQIARLDAIGMRWESMNTVSWERHFRACAEYKEAHGDLLVPHDHVTAEGVNLGSWIARIRKMKHNGAYGGYLTPEGVRRLDALGMVWNEPDYLWEKNYAVALAYYREHGDVNIPAAREWNGVGLGRWLEYQRQIYRGNIRNKSLTREQTERLEALGIRWDRRTDILWRQGLAEAERYFAEHGVTDPPGNYAAPSGFKLGEWIMKCRSSYEKGKLSPERTEALRRLGVPWLEKNPAAAPRNGQAQAAVRAAAP